MTGSQRKPGRPSREEAALLVEDVLDRTLATLRSVGFGDLSIEVIAAQAGVTKRTLYRRFASKDALIEAVVARELERLLNTGIPAEDGSVTPLERLHSAAHYHFHYLLDAGNCAFKNFLIVDMVTNSGDPGRQRRWFLALLAPFRLLIEAAQNAGQLRPGDPFELAQLLFDLIDAAGQHLCNGLGSEIAFGERNSDAYFAVRWDAFLQIATKRS